MPITTIIVTINATAESCNRKKKEAGTKMVDTGIMDDAEVHQRYWDDMRFQPKRGAKREAPVPVKARKKKKKRRVDDDDDEVVVFPSLPPHGGAMRMSDLPCNRRNQTRRRATSHRSCVMSLVSRQRLVSALSS